MVATTTESAARDEVPVSRSGARSPWFWIPTLYFGQGIPYVVAMTLSVIMYKNLAISNTDIALYTSWLYLPWVIKPLWSPVVDIFRTKRFWITTLQLFIGAALACVALTIPTSHFFQLTLAVFWLMAFASATHDIAADGFYMLALKQHEQAAFVGVRSTFYRVATLVGQGGLVFLAGKLADRTGDVKMAWSIIFFILAGLFLAQFAYHRFILPTPASDRPTRRGSSVLSDFVGTFRAFFAKPHIGLTLGFLLTFRLGEAQAIKLVTPFLLDPRAKGGLGLDTSSVGLVYGTIGVTALTIGGVLGGIAIAKHGLKRFIWIMLLATHVPIAAFVFLSLVQPTSLPVIGAAIAAEQLGYGFGFTAYMLFMIMVADGPNKTAHYAICTGFMALGMMLPGMASGWIQDHLGYAKFFLWVLLACVPSLVITAFLKIDPEFGKKKPA